MVGPKIMPIYSPQVQRLLKHLKVSCNRRAHSSLFRNMRLVFLNVEDKKRKKPHVSAPSSLGFQVHNMKTFHKEKIINKKQGPKVFDIEKKKMANN